MGCGQRTAWYSVSLKRFQDRLLEMRMLSGGRGGANLTSDLGGL